MSSKSTRRVGLSIAAVLFLFVLAIGWISGCGNEKAEAPANNPIETSQAPAPAAPAETKAPEQPAAQPAPAGSKKRVVILGFDGVEPTIVDAMFAANELPNLAKLRDGGSYKPLTSAIPPQSPSAWSSFITCKNTGAHGIYDFVARDPAYYIPKPGFGRTEHTKLDASGAVTQAARFTSYRKGDSFWKIADGQGLKITSLMVPFAFPADDMSQGHMLCGLGVQDIRGTDSSFFSFSDTYEKQESIAGGALYPLVFDGDVAKVTIPGARDMRNKYGAPGAFVEVDISFKVDRAAHTVAVTTQTETITAKKDEWSQWVRWTFELSPSYSVHAISRFYVIDAGEHVNIYMACLQYDPKSPYIRFTTPETFSGELEDRYGLYKTIGWDFDTHALRKDTLTEDAFLTDVAQTMAWHERLVLDEMDKEKNMLIAAWTGPDRVSHMFWRFRDPKHPLYTEEGSKKYGRAVEDTYKKMDEIVGKVVAKLAPDDLLLILSDHGFKSFRKGLNVNTWLVRNGYLNIKGQPDAATAFSDDSNNFLDSIYDWTTSKAYSVGMGSIFLNLQGREAQGIVTDAESSALIEEIKGKLLALTDPETGEKVFDNIYTREVFTGESAANAPDLQLAYADGFQSSKPTASGRAPADIFEINDDKWSGEHASSDVANTPGIFFANKKINTDAPRIIDLGVTALTYVGAKVPADFEGKLLLDIGERVQ
ncbi:MAG: alkaline phosphatase family protein [Candidatus Hydrogenedentes bacterium]|nr:alkaline phosphatase family protein [Candidatus Hydrogenedentota bacterium]